VKLDIDNMSWYKKIYWRIKLWRMDHRLPLFATHGSLLEPSYYYTHTKEECEMEMRRRKEEIMKIIEDTPVDKES